jgi:hypothetical protein
MKKCVSQVGLFSGPSGCCGDCLFPCQLPWLVPIVSGHATESFAQHSPLQTTSPPSMTADYVKFLAVRCRYSEDSSHQMAAGLLHIHTVWASLTETSLSKTVLLFP